MKMLTPPEVAERLRVHPGTLQAWRAQKRGPAFVLVEGRVRYPADGVDAYLAERTVHTEDQR